MYHWHPSSSLELTVNVSGQFSASVCCPLSTISALWVIVDTLREAATHSFASGLWKCIGTRARTTLLWDCQKSAGFALFSRTVVVVFAVVVVTIAVVVVVVVVVIIGSAEALPILCVRYFRWEREREIQTERERRKWRHHCRAKIADEFTLSLAKNSHNWRWAYTFPCQKFALFVSPFTLPVSPFTERSPLWRWNSQRVHTFHCQRIFRPRCSRSVK